MPVCLGSDTDHNFRQINLSQSKVRTKFENGLQKTLFVPALKRNTVPRCLPCKYLITFLNLEFFHTSRKQTDNLLHPLILLKQSVKGKLLYYLYVEFLAMCRQKCVYSKLYIKICIFIFKK